MGTILCMYPLQWRLNERDGVSNHQPHDCLLNRLFRHRSKKASKLRVTGLCEENSPVTGKFPAQRASNAENASIWWRHHANDRMLTDYIPWGAYDDTKSLRKSCTIICPDHVCNLQISSGFASWGKCPYHVDYRPNNIAQYLKGSMCLYLVQIENTVSNIFHQIITEPWSVRTMGLHWPTRSNLDSDTDK